MAQPIVADPAPHDPSAPEAVDASSEKPAKKAKTERAPRPPRPAGERPKSDGPRKKRGPARPHRRLDIETITSRIEKLDKRRLRAKEQLEDATRHVEGYQAERTFREQEAATAAKE
jgi:hypothetical protein